jgi:hypothetical protein
VRYAHHSSRGAPSAPYGNATCQGLRVEAWHSLLLLMDAVKRAGIVTDHFFNDPARHMLL